MAVSGQDGDRRTGPEHADDRSAPEVVGDGFAPVDGTPQSTRLLIAAAVVVLGLGALAVVVTLADPHRLGVAFSGGGGRAPGPTVTVAAEPGGFGAAATEAAASQTATGPARTDGSRAVTAPLDGRRRASFELGDGLTRFDLRVDDLGEELYRISTPPDAGVRPRPEVLGDLVRLRVEASGQPGPAAVEVVLNARVTWRLRLAGAVTEQRLDLARSRLAGLDLVGPATLTELRLPRVTGALTVRVTGGVTRLDILLPGDPPVRVRAASGAVAVTIHGRRAERVAAGTVLGPPGWDRSADRLYVDLVGAANTVTVSG